jgi:hypothetical protein
MLPCFARGCLVLLLDMGLRRTHTYRTDIFFLSCLSCSWVIDTYFSESDIAKLLKLGVYSPKYMAEDAIDVKSSREDTFR